MLDLTVERPISLQEAARFLPPGRNSRPVHISALLRWITAGARGPGGRRIRLEAIRMGGRWLTSREALQRFGERLTGQTDSYDLPRTASARRRESVAAGEQLDAAGI
jgi:hypothetical protein